MRYQKHRAQTHMHARALASYLSPSVLSVNAAPRSAVTTLHSPHPNASAVRFRCGSSHLERPRPKHARGNFETATSSLPFPAVFNLHLKLIHSAIGVAVARRAFLMRTRMRVPDERCQQENGAGYKRTRVHGNHEGDNSSTMTKLRSAVPQRGQQTAWLSLLRWGTRYHYHPPTSSP